MDYIELVKLGIEIGIPLLVGVGGSYFLLFKKKLKAFRNLIDSVDDAVYDNNVSEEEFLKIYEHAKELIQK